MNNIFNSIKWIVAGSFFKRIVLVLVYHFFIKYVQADDFGTFNEFTNFLGIIAIVSFVSTEYLVFTKGDRQNKHEAMFQIGFIGFILTSIAVFLFADSISSWYKNPSLVTVLTFSPIILLIEYLRKSLRIHYQKEQQFKIISQAEILNTIIYCTLFCIVLPFKSSALFLVSLYYIGNIFELTFLFLKNKKLITDVKNSFRFKYINSFKHIISNERHFLGITTLSHTFGFFGDSSPILLFGKLIGTTATGVYALTNQLISTPIQMLLQPIEKVFFAHLARLTDKEINEKIIKFSRFCISFVWPSFVVTIFVLSKLIQPLFNDKWLDVLQILKPVALMQALRLFIVPISSIPLIKKRTDLELIYKIISMILRSSIIYLFYSKGLIATMWAYSITQVTLYIYLFVLIMYVLKSNLVLFLRNIFFIFTLTIVYTLFVFNQPNTINDLLQITFSLVAFLVVLYIQNRLVNNLILNNVKSFLKR